MPTLSRRHVLAASAALAALTLPPVSLAASPSLPAAPKPMKKPKTITQVGRTRTDEYQWMKDDNWQQVLKDPSVLRADIRDHLLKENAWFDARMADTKPLQERLFEEMKGRTKDDDSSVPAPDGPWAYYVRFDKGAQHPLYARTPRNGGKEEVLLDVEAMSKGKAYFQVSATAQSPDHKLYAWAEDDAGAGTYRLRVKDVATGQTVGTPMESTSGSFTAIFTSLSPSLYTFAFEPSGSALANSRANSCLTSRAQAMGEGTFLLQASGLAPAASN